jgi:4-hydroxy-4-methyl-2-oxoglutarate aldolase
MRPAPLRTLALLLLPALGAAEQAAAPVQAPPSVRASRNTYSAVMDVLGPSRPRLTDEQVARLKKVPIEAVWGAVQAKEYRHSFVNDLKLTQPGTKLVGRALTMRYLPVRPDLVEAVQTLGKEGDWFYQYNIRAGEDTRPGDVLVVELGGMVDRATFMGDVTGLGIKSRGAAGVVIDGGLRDLSEFLPWKDFPVYYTGAHASAMADQVGVEWNAPVRIKTVTVLPGDVVVGDESGVLFFPPQIADDVIKSAENTVYIEDFKREMIRGTKYRARDVYPVLSPELEKVFEEWKKSHPRRQP